jgi:hypothetical protein
MRRTYMIYIAPWVPNPRCDTKITVPPPPAGEVGGSPGVSVSYSERLSSTPHWKRMAFSTYSLRMRENETRYPMSQHNKGEYDIRFLPTPYRDNVKNKPLLEIGEPHSIPVSRIRIPVIFLVDLWDEANGEYFGRKFETVYVLRNFMREELHPQRFAIYATVEAYELLGLPVVDHKVHQTIPKNDKEHEKLLEQQHWDEEPWKYTIEFLFRKYDDVPAELLPIAEEWDGREELASSGDSSSAAQGAAKKGPIKQRKARKVKLF